MASNILNAVILKYLEKARVCSVEVHWNDCEWQEWVRFGVEREINGLLTPASTSEAQFLIWFNLVLSNSIKKKSAGKNSLKSIGIVIVTKVVSA